MQTKSKRVIKTAAKRAKIRKTATVVHRKRVARKIRARPLKVLKTRFTGKLMRREDGVKALDRKYTDQKAFNERRRQEQAPPGGWPKSPAHWPEGVRVDVRHKPVYWLPPKWGQGVKTTCAAWLTAFVAPSGKVYYHRHVVRELYKRETGRDLPKSMPEHDPRMQAHYELQRGLAFNTAKQAIKNGNTWDMTEFDLDPDRWLFAQLEQHEKRCLPEAKELHFAVISARRASDPQGLKRIVNVEGQIKKGGATSTWYVDRESKKQYQSLGLKTVVGGKLIPARNKALKAARRMKKACVQISDDIMHWDYRCTKEGKRPVKRDMFRGNRTAKRATHLRVSPVAAARFLLAKLRAHPTAQLAGVFPCSNTGQACGGPRTTFESFILGDFFVVNRSTCKFETQMSLKEDYDFTCEHLARHGAVIRCNRMFIDAVHETNVGGACTVRDAQGRRERQNIKVLQRKWPGVFYTNKRRGDGQVVMRWHSKKARAARPTGKVAERGETVTK